MKNHVFATADQHVLARVAERAQRPAHVALAAEWGAALSAQELRQVRR